MRCVFARRTPTACLFKNTETEPLACNLLLNKNQFIYLAFRYYLVTTAAFAFVCGVSWVQNLAIVLLISRRFEPGERNWAFG